MLCPKCQLSVENASQLPSGLWQCPHCAVQFMHALPAAAPVEAKPERKPDPAAPVATPLPPGSASRGRSKSLSPWLLLLAAGVIVVLTTRSRSERLPTFMLAAADPTKSADCLRKPKCVIVYVAPWCPHCHSSRAAIRSLAADWQRSGDIGITVVVGRDEPERLRAMAADYPEVAFLDADGSFYEEAKIKGVPHWLVVETPSKIVKRFAGGFPNAASAREYLGLSGQ